MTPGLVPPSLSSNHLHITPSRNEHAERRRRVQGICSSKALVRPHIIPALGALSLLPLTSVRFVKVHTNSILVQCFFLSCNGMLTRDREFFEGISVRMSSPVVAILEVKMLGRSVLPQYGRQLIPVLPHKPGKPFQAIPAGTLTLDGACFCVMMPTPLHLPFLRLCLAPRDTLRLKLPCRTHAIPRGPTTHVKARMPTLLGSYDDSAAAEMCRVTTLLQK